VTFEPITVKILKVLFRKNSKQFILVPNSIKVVNMVKFLQVVHCLDIVLTNF